MEQLLLLGNPSDRRRRRYRKNAESRSERSKAARLGWRRRRSGSRRYRRNPETHAERVRAAHLGWRRRRAGSRRYRRNPESFAERSSASRRGWAHRRRYRRNPINTGSGSLVDLLKASAIMGGGALGVDVLMGLIHTKLPTSLAVPVDTTTGTTNWGYFAVKLGLAAGIAHFGDRVMSRDTADALGTGAMSVTLYGLMRGMIPAGTLPLASMNPALVLPRRTGMDGVRLNVAGVRLPMGVAT